MKLHCSIPGSQELRGHSDHASDLLSSSTLSAPPASVSYSCHSTDLALDDESDDIGIEKDSFQLSNIHSVVGQLMARSKDVILCCLDLAAILQRMKGCCLALNCQHSMQTVASHTSGPSSDHVMLCHL